MAGLLRWQSLLLLISGVTCSVFSIVGSCLIILAIVKRGKPQLQKEALFQLLLGLGVGDFLSSLALLWAPFLVPSQGSSRPWAFGTEATCWMTPLVHGFGFLMSCFYNCWVSIHFWRIVQENQKQRHQRNRQECLHTSAHILAIGIPLILAIAGLITQSYHLHPLLGVCYFGDILAMLNVGLMTLLGLLGIGFAIALTRKVRASFQRSGRYSMRNLAFTAANPDGSNDTKTTTNSEPANANNHNLRALMSDSTRSARNSVGSSRNSLGSARSQLMKRVSSFQRISNFSLPDMFLLEVDTRQKEVAVQAFWYMVAYLNTFLLPLVALVVNSTTNAVGNQGSPGNFLLLLCLYTFIPLQGTLNFAVFIRPRYIAWKAHMQRQEEVEQTRRSLQQPTRNRASVGTTPWYAILQKAIVADVPPPSARLHTCRKRRQDNEDQLGCHPPVPTIPALKEDVDDNREQEGLVESEIPPTSTSAMKGKSRLAPRLPSAWRDRKTPSTLDHHHHQQQQHLLPPMMGPASEKFFSAYLSTCFSIADLEDDCSSIMMLEESDVDEEQETDDNVPQECFSEELEVEEGADFDV